MTFWEWFASLFAPKPQTTAVVIPIKPQPTGKVRELVIDTSHYEPAVDWAKAKASGVKGMYTKATEGLGHVDKSLHQHADSAKAAGLKTGAYHFFHEGMDGDAQAALYLHAVSGMVFDYPHILDWEGSSGDGREDAYKWLVAVEKSTGIQPWIYSGESHLRELKLDSRFAKYGVIIAHYGTTEDRVRLPAPFLRLIGWQYTDAEGAPRVDGLGAGHHVDANWFYV
jgi:lysozyme